MSQSLPVSPVRSCYLDKQQLARLIEVLYGFDYEVIGPTLGEAAIVYDRITSINDLPRGWTDIQEPGRYQLQERNDDALFGYSVSPLSWNHHFFPPMNSLSIGEQAETGTGIPEEPEQPSKLAFLGIRACDLAALKIQDQTFLRDAFVDPIYQNRRQQTLIIAVNCTQAAETCFCTSMNTGPRCEAGFDLALTELTHGFIVEVATPAGEAVINALPTGEPTDAQLAEADAARQQAVDQIQRFLETDTIRDVLRSQSDSPRWEKLAERCLSCTNCTNCTMVCPTCFCSSVEEISDLTCRDEERQLLWDSCFKMKLSRPGGGQERPRYQQWLAHKLASSTDPSSCVGCGRCMTWCPAGIDLTQEVAAIRKAGET